MTKHCHHLTRVLNFFFSFYLTFLCRLTSTVNVIKCAVCHQDCKQIDIIENYFVKDTTEASSTLDETAAQVRLCFYSIRVLFCFQPASNNGGVALKIHR